VFLRYLPSDLIVLFVQLKIANIYYTILRCVGWMPELVSVMTERLNMGTSLGDSGAAEYKNKD